jgi:hypothetical protein
MSLYKLYRQFHNVLVPIGKFNCFQNTQRATFAVLLIIVIKRTINLIQRVYN